VARTDLSEAAAILAKRKPLSALGNPVSNVPGTRAGGIANEQVPNACIERALAENAVLRKESPRL
jgi:hypothetical protein